MDHDFDDEQGTPPPLPQAEDHYESEHGDAYSAHPQYNYIDFAKDKIRIPAILQLIFSILSALFCLGYTCFCAAVAAGLFPAFADNMSQTQQMPFPPETLFLMYTCIYFVLTLLYMIVAIAAYRMLILKNYTFSMVGAILGLIPCACCIVTFPWALWSLILLLNEEVKTGFRQNEEQNRSTAEA